MTTSSGRSSADAQRANCEAPERAGTDRHRQPCLHPYPIIRDAPGARTRPLRCFAIRVLSSYSWRCKTWIVSRWVLAELRIWCKKAPLFPPNESNFLIWYRENVLGGTKCITRTRFVPKKRFTWHKMLNQW